MEIIMISDDKLKLMLTKEELVTFDLNVSHADHGKIESKRMLRGILKYLKEQIGFRTDGYRVLVQLFPSRDGGCELFITRIAEVVTSHINPSETEVSDWHSEADHGLVDLPIPKTGAYAFDRLEWLLTVCRQLKRIGYVGNSDAYIGDDHRYFLFLQGMAPHGYLPLDEYSFILEYGTSENAEALQDFLCEHGRRVCNADAVERLSVL